MVNKWKQIPKGENAVGTSYEEVYTAGNRIHDTRRHSDDTESDQLPSHSTIP